MNIGFIGAGMMGRFMAANLIKAGHALAVHSRARQKAEGLVAQGARWRELVRRFPEARAVQEVARLYM